MENTTKPVMVITVKDTIDVQRKGIDDAHEKFLPEVKSLAADLGVHEEPGRNSLSIEPFIETVRAKYSGILNDVLLNFSANVRNQLGALDIFNLRQKIKDLKLKDNTESKALEALQASKGKLTGHRTANEYERLKQMLNIFTVIETLGYILAFISIGDNILLSIIWGLIISLLQTIGLKALVLWMRDGAGKELSRLVKGLIWGGVALVATGLGLLRYASVQAGGDNGFAQSALAPFVFILISYFLIAVLAMYVWHYYPMPQELATMKKVAELDAEIAAKTTELNECRQQYRQLEDDCSTVAQVHTLLIQAAKDFYHRVNHHFLYAVGIFKTANRIHRKDNLNPECFSQTVQALDMPSYDGWDDLELDTKPITKNL